MLPRRQYSVIVSLGVNCEVSYHLNRVFGFVDSYPLTWAFVDDVKYLPGFLQDPHRLFESKNVQHDYSCNMCFYAEYGIHFHCQGGPETLLDETGKVSPDKSRQALDEVASRMRYLSDKFLALLRDPERSVLCVLTVWEWSRTQDLLDVHKVLSNYPKVDLLAVLTGKEPNVDVRELKRHGIIVRSIARHPPHNAVTDPEQNDIVGWNRIFSEFTPTERREKSKRFKFEH